MAKLFLDVPNRAELYTAFTNLLKGCPLELNKDMDKICDAVEHSIYIQDEDSTNGQVFICIFPNAPWYIKGILRHTKWWMKPCGYGK